MMLTDWQPHRAVMVICWKVYNYQHANMLQNLIACTDPVIQTNFATENRNQYA